MEMSNTQPSLLDSNGQPIPLENITFLSDTKIVATANLQNKTPGNYTVKLIDGAQTATAANIFSVDSGNPGKLDVAISSTGAIRAGSIGEVIVTYRNSGETDIAAPLLTINATGGKFEKDGQYLQNSVQFLGINKDGNAGILSPGATSSYKVNFRADSGVGAVNFTLSSLDTTASIDWAAIKNSSRPADVDPATWDLIYQNFVNSVSSNASNFQAVLDENATRLSQLGEYTGDISKLLAFELRQNAAQSIDDRNFVGTFGRGGVNAFEIAETVDANGNVTIQSGTIRRLFNKQANGTYKADDVNDLGVVSKVGSIYQLREYDGTNLAFRTDGKLDFVTDPNNNKVTVGYTSSQLTSLSYSNGDIINFAYNPQGRVREVTDQYGQKTSYTYDAAGEKLLSIIDNSGTTSYTYETAGAKANAVKSITFADGTQTLYEYDANGRISKLSNGTNSVTYSYDSAGGITITDGNNKATKILTNDRGQIAQATDSLGRTLKYTYDDNGNLKQVIAPDNSNAKFSYDSRGNIVGSVDALNQQVNYTYNSTYDQLTKVQDQKGNNIAYSYDTKGNLSGIVYADGSQDTFNYDANGNTTVSSNRRGQEVKYTYDSRQFLIGKEFADGTTASFEYDTRGNLTKATDSDSTVSYTYDNADKLTKVTYDNSRFLEFTYNPGGQRTKMVDQDGFATNYSYDSVGRLKQLTDKAGANIVTYTYDNIGQLAREDNGNGTYTTYSYDGAGQALSIVNFKADNTVNSRFDYTYDNLGRRDSMTTLEGKTTYGYDATGQLTKATLANGRVIEYQYDAAGNRTTVKDSGTTTNYATNNLNEYTAAGNATYTYDKDGNLTAKTEGTKTTTFTYDSENRLIGVTNPDGTWQYQYDALGNRIATTQNGTRTDYLLDPTGLGDVVGEYNGANKVASYTHGLGLVSRVDGSNTASFYDADAIGSIAGLSGTNGNYLDTYSYLPFGESLTKTEAVANPFEFVGQYGVMNESNGLDFMRARFYTPGEGRFLNTDPIGINGGDTNFYRYSNNNPQNFIDPTGLAYFAKKPLHDGLEKYEYSTDVGDLINGELLHEQIVFDRPQIIPGYNNNKPVSNIGFGQGNRLILGGVFGNGGLFHFDLKNKQDLKDFNRLQKSSGHFDDKIIVEAIKRTKTKYYDVIPFDPNGDNCQEWAERVRNEYDKIKKDNDRASAQTSVFTSRDPNDIIGPGGAGTDRWIYPDSILPYTINFENKSTATAPAVLVSVTQQFDSDLDLSTFELGSFGFHNLTFKVPDGLQGYTTRLDLRSTIGALVDVAANLDTSTSTLIWTITTIDPTTGQLATGVNDGFLPPDNANNDGQGFVGYSVKPKTRLANATIIDAKASIVFDSNAPIDTPVWLNKIDTNVPTSSVTPLPTTTATPNFTVAWSGTDSGSGIASYDVYASIDGSAFTLWQNDTTATFATYTGQIGHTYAFYSTATDNVGYIEANLATADTTITVIAVNNPPVVEANKTIALQEDTSIPLTIATPTDPDGNALTITVNTLPDSTKGAIRVANGNPITPNQTLTLADLTGLVFVPIANANGSAGTFSYTVSDGQGGTASQTITFAINPVNDAPIGSPTAILPAGIEDTLYTISASTLLTGFSDVDGDTLSVTNLTATNGSLVNNGNGTYSFTPTANYNGLINLTYNVIDGNGGSIAATQSFSLTAVNDLPTISPISKSGNEDTIINFIAADFTNAFSDIDNNSLTKIQITSLPINGTLKLSGTAVNLNQEITAANLGNLTFTPNANFNGSISFSWNGFDGTAYAATGATVNLSILSVNDPPIAVNDTAQVNQNSSVIINLLTNDSDIDGSLVPSTVAISNSPSHGTVTLNPITGVATYIPTSNYTGTDSFTYTVKDNENGISNPATVNITVNSTINNIQGTPGADLLVGTDLVDTIDGKAGNDTITGKKGNDTLIGGGGRDKFVINLGDGDDTITDFGGVGIGSNPSSTIRAEVDTIQFQGTGLTARNLLLTQNGTNLELTFEGISGTKVVLQNFALQNLDNIPPTGSNPATGNIIFTGQTSISDSYDVFDANSTQTSLFGNNTVTFLNDLNNKVNGVDNSNDVINGQGGNDTLDGKGGNDLLRGGAGNDTLLGGAGNDILRGGSGNDILTGGIGNDTFVLASGDGTDTITDFNRTADKIGLANGLSFGQLTITQGVGSNTLNALITDSSNNELLAILNGTQANTLTSGMFMSV